MYSSPFERLAKMAFEQGCALWSAWTKEKAPALRNSPGENSVYALCKPHAYKATQKEVLDALHFLFKEYDIEGLSPMRWRRIIGERIFESVARISCKETMDLVITGYELIYMHNNSPFEKV